MNGRSSQTIYGAPPGMLDAGPGFAGGAGDLAG
jgi:hypothetical protein